ncbi:MAG: hypothetical protein Q8R26_01525, partial [bacterium]|nr:hypothetical protein [bacterium]
MQQKTFNTIVGIFFSIGGLVHLARALMGWEVAIGTFVVPLWFSYVAVVFAGFLVYQAFKTR